MLRYTALNFEQSKEYKFSWDVMNIGWACSLNINLRKRKKSDSGSKMRILATEMPPAAERRHEKFGRKLMPPHTNWKASKTEKKVS